MRSIVASALLSVLLPGVAAAAPLTINEFYRDTSLGATGNEWIEVVLTEDLTAAQLETYFVGDSQSATTSKFASYRFTGMSDIASTFRAGTLIVVGGGTVTADHTYAPGSGDWNVTLLTNDATHIVGNGNTGDLAGTDVAWVDTDGTSGATSFTGAKFAVNWDSTPGTLGAVADVLVGVPANITGVVNGAGVADAGIAGSWTVSVAPASLTQGQPNGGANSLSIVALRAGGACADADADTVCDTEDVCPGGDDRVDSDFDLTPDDCDLCPVDGDPGDADADGVCNSDDVCPNGDDAVDVDLDGIPDDCDDCIGGDGSDTDLDGVEDFCDTCPLDAPDEDDDNDGVCDSDDVCSAGDDLSDTDLDGTPDACDACPLDGDPGDADADGVCDSADLCAAGDDGIDADGDGIPDACDNCLGGTGADTDGDGADDFCDPCPLDAPDHDDDGDGVCDSDDTCPAGNDALDADNDGTPDACDVCPLDGDPGDADADSVCDSADVCPTGDDTVDTDGDSVPDACDTCPSAPNGGDADADGVPDGCDNCVDAANPSQRDTDNDNLGNACDAPLLSAVNAPRAGQTLFARVTGAEPGESVVFLASPGGAGVGPCSVALGGLCFDLGAPYVVIGTVIADANGTATRSMTVPATVGAVYSVQAAVLRGDASEKSNRLTGTIQP